MLKAKRILLAVVCLLIAAVVGCSIPDVPDMPLTMQFLVGQWEEWSRTLGLTGIIYEFHDDRTMQLLDSDVTGELLTGQYDIEDGRVLVLQLRESSFGFSLGKTRWEALSVSQSDLVFRVPFDSRIQLKRIQ